MLFILESCTVGFTVELLVKNSRVDLSPCEKYFGIIELPVPLSLGTTGKSFTPWLEISLLVVCHWLRAPFRRERKYCNSEYILFAFKKNS